MLLKIDIVPQIPFMSVITSAKAKLLPVWSAKPHKPIKNLKHFSLPNHGEMSHVIANEFSIAFTQMLGG
jgi:hypothetical protein